MQWFSVFVSKLEALASPGNLVEIQIFRPHAGPTESDTLEVGLSNLYFNKSPGDSDTY